MGIMNVSKKKIFEKFIDLKDLNDKIELAKKAYIDKYYEDETISIDRRLWWEYFYNQIKLTFIEVVPKSITKKEDQVVIKVNYLIERFEMIRNSILNSINAAERKINEIDFDVTNKFLEEYTIFAENEQIMLQEKTDFRYYPEYSDDKFNEKIYKKKEFYNNKARPIKNYESILSSNSQGFKRSFSQKFVSNYLSDNTPYNGILLWHGVGVGKTCAAISIAENFREFVKENSKKILVLTPSETLQQNWKDEIFSIEKENNNRTSSSVQCTGTTYMNELVNFNNKNEKQQKSQVNKGINRYYEFMGFKQLSNHIERRFR